MASPTAVESIRDNIVSVIKGKEAAVDMALIGLISGGHVLIEDVPGVGKTTLARALARSIEGVFRRIQFTPDLLPADILGVSIYRENSADFEFQPGPLFANIVLADEINRASPRTQSSLLEAMNDQQITVDGTTHPLEEPFLVLATQNPIEVAGTYPLPESQLDRFLLRIRMGYPDRDDELRILSDQQISHPLDALKAVATADDVVKIQALVREVTVSPELAEYVVALVQATRESDELRLGASPRASLALYRASQARALLDGRDFVLPDDVKALASPVLAHRVLSRDGAGRSSRDSEQIVRDLLDALPVPL